MVVKMMKWRPWPPLSSKKFEAKIVVGCLKGLSISSEEVESLGDFQDFERLVVEIRWKGSAKVNPLALNSLRRRVRRNFTKEGSLIKEDGVVQWEEEFKCECNFSAYKDDDFLPWEVAFSLFNGLSKGPTNKVPTIATGTLNLSDFASVSKEKDVEINIPLDWFSSAVGPLLCLSLNLVELGNDREGLETGQKFDISRPMYPTCGEFLSKDRNDGSPLRASLGKVGIFKALSVRGRKKAYREDEGSDGKCSVRSCDTEYNYPVDTDSLSDSEDGESEEGKEGSVMRKTVSYETLAFANHASSENGDWIYYSHRKSDAGCVYLEDRTGLVVDQSIQQSSKRKILPWGKRKLNLRSPKRKGEPLLKKHYGEEGGDDIDFDRRQLSSSDDSSHGWRTEDGTTISRSSVSEFGDDNFAVGSWEAKEIISRDGQMKLRAEVFFASIDQRSERAAGESACTSLVVAIADWFHSNRDEMPIKSQLDSLIHEGSLEWRKLCENESYRERFPDKHFDLETVLEAKVSPLSVAPQKSFIGFFHPEGIEDDGFDFLKGAMSFDNIWDEISKPTTRDASIYIVSWNDHFFVLKVEQDAYYIIDTLGERLYEGCNQAFILRFDRDTTISLVANETQPPTEDSSASAKTEDNIVNAPKTNNEESTMGGEPDNNEQESMVCRGKDSCKEYIKSFLAAIPIRELQVDLKKGLRPSMPLHQRLQIEFHYTNYKLLSLCDGGVEPSSDL
ncbi:PREDICTED: uncharacterized protein LOC109147923 [Ipomoea nil]|uniref:uncharacterized protein LOC109147923 n=1 Tax=Ipomoea nil TaxID=35883 RepID=UPI000900A1BB|nr:PREDICTED: uncharacterized protein LOC109147923 [Ipomoea nil]